MCVCGGGQKIVKKLVQKVSPKLYESSNLKLGSQPQSYLLATASYVKKYIQYKESFIRNKHVDNVTTVLDDL